MALCSGALALNFGTGGSISSEWVAPPPRNIQYTPANLRFYHEFARKHLDAVLAMIENEKQNKSEMFFEPIDLSVWEELSFEYQRDLTHAILGYRLTRADVKSCPVFPQVKESEKQLKLADYVIIQGEPGCGKSISLYQVAYRFYENGWRIYLLKQGNNNKELLLPNNTENSVYLIDDAQIYSESLVSQVIRQAQSNRKVLLAKTISDSIDFDCSFLVGIQ